MAKILTFDRKEKYEDFIHIYGLDLIHRSDLVAYKCGEDMWFKVKSRLSKSDCIISNTLFNTEVIKTIMPQTKMQGISIEPSRPYLFCIANDNKDLDTNHHVTVLIRNIEFESMKKVNIEYIHDEDNTFEKFITNNKHFIICLLSRTGEVTKRIHINIKNYYGGYPKRLSHEATDLPVIMTSTLELE